MSRTEGAGRCAVITGGANGIGAETARQLVGRGWRVVLVDVDEPALAASADALGPGALPVLADVTDEAAMRTAIVAAVERFGRVDVVVNAAIETLGPVASMAPTDAARVIEVDLLGAWTTVRVALPEIARARGYVLLVTSVAAATQGPFNWAYSAAKAGVVALGRTLRLETRGTGVDVGIAYFGYVDTPTARRSVEHPAMAPIMASIPGPMRRPVPVERAAAGLVRAIERRARRVVVPRSMAVAVELPELAQRLSERAVRRVRLDWRE